MTLNRSFSSSTAVFRFFVPGVALGLIVGGFVGAVALDHVRFGPDVMAKPRMQGAAMTAATFRTISAATSEYAANADEQLTESPAR